MVLKTTFVYHDHGEEFEGYEVYLIHACMDGLNGDVELVKESTNRISIDTSLDLGWDYG